MMKAATPIGWRWLRATEHLIDSRARYKKVATDAEALVA